MTLDETQKTLVGSVLDVRNRYIRNFSGETDTLPKLFAGKPSLKKLRLWHDEATFEDPLTKAVGRKQFEPQWVCVEFSFLKSETSVWNLERSNYKQYGLQAAFSEIERLHHEVIDGGNPIVLDLKTRYVVKGIGKEQTIASKVNIFYDQSIGKITQVQDKWDGELPDSSFKNVSVAQLFRLSWWIHYGEGWAWWLWSFTWNTWGWQVCAPAYHIWTPFALAHI